MKKFIYLFLILTSVFSYIFFNKEETFILKESIYMEREVIKEKDLTVFNERKSVNEDYIGEIIIEDLINEYVVQTVDNEFYLKHDFYKNEFSQGSIFLDYRNSLDDQNLIIYGHYVYKDETSKFSLLHLLKEEENYEKYKNIKLDLGYEVREYVVSKVYYYDMDSDKLIYFLTNYSNEELNSYLNSVDEVKFYDTGVEISIGDKFLTLQTCVRNRNDLRLIILAKEIEK